MPIDPDTRARLLRERVRHGPVSLRVEGSSMGGAIRGGSEVTVVAGDRSPRRGEVWAFVASDGSLFVHRCRRSSGPTFVFQGDANAGPDQPVPADRLVGRVVARGAGSDRAALGRRDRARGGLVLAYRDVRAAIARSAPSGLRRWVAARPSARRR